MLSSMLSTTKTTAQSNLATLGYADLNKPTEIDIYPNDFDAKTTIKNVLNDYNQQMKDSGQNDKVIIYTDLVATMMKSVTDIIKLCEEAAAHKFAAVCVPPCYVGLAANQLRGTGVNVATVIGFPLGSSTTAVKVAETKDAVENKADEIDMVINVGAIKSGMWDAVTADIRAVVEAAGDAKVKVIIETSQLTDEEKVRATECTIEAGADFVKTSTGFIGGGASYGFE